MIAKYFQGELSLHEEQMVLHEVKIYFKYHNATGRYRRHFTLRECVARLFHRP